MMDLIKSNIEKYKYHLTVVNGEKEPRYVYSIGLSDFLNFELIFAGGVYYLKDGIYQIFKVIVEKLKDDVGAVQQKIAI